MNLRTTSPDLDNALVDAANWADEDGIHAQLTWLRQNDPLRYLQPEGFDPFWNVTKYDDIKEIEGKKQIFINGVLENTSANNPGVSLNANSAMRIGRSR